MVSFNKGKVERALKSKGTDEAYFHEERKSDHVRFYLIVQGIDTGIWTKVSHGGGKKSINDWLINQMAKKQLKITKRDFLDYIGCNTDCDDIVEILRENGEL